jgi:hypothetical protein
MPVAAVMAGGQPGHQHRVQRRHARHHARVDDHQLGLALGVGDHRRHRDLGAGAGGRRHGVDRFRRLQSLQVAGQLAQRLGVGDRQRDRLAGVHGRAAAEGHDGVAVMLAVEGDAALDQRDRRVGRDLVEDHELRAAGGKRAGQAVQQTQAHDDGVGDDQHLAVAEAGDGLPQPAAGPWPDQQGGLRNRDEARDLAGPLHQRFEPGGTRRLGNQIEDHALSPCGLPPRQAGGGWSTASYRGGPVSTVGANSA